MLFCQYQYPKNEPRFSEWIFFFSLFPWFQREQGPIMLISVIFESPMLVRITFSSLIYDKFLQWEDPFHPIRCSWTVIISRNEVLAKKVIYSDSFIDVLIFFRSFSASRRLGKIAMIATKKPSEPWFYWIKCCYSDLLWFLYLVIANSKAFGCIHLKIWLFLIMIFSLLAYP